MEKYLLSTQGLTKQYGRQKAVDHIDIHIKKGAFMGLLEEMEQERQRHLR